MHTLDIAPLRSESPLQKRSGMAHVLKGSHSFTCTPTRSSAIRMSHTCLCLPRCSWYSFAVLFKGERLRDQPSPEMLTSKIFNTISAYLYSCRCQYCYHIKQKYCIFFPPKAFCDNQKVLKRLGELTTFPRPPVGWGGEHPFPIPTPRHLRHLDNGALFQ